MRACKTHRVRFVDLRVLGLLLQKYVKQVFCLSEITRSTQLIDKEKRIRESRQINVIDIVVTTSEMGGK